MGKRSGDFFVFCRASNPFSEGNCSNRAFSLASDLFATSLRQVRYSILNMSALSAAIRGKTIRLNFMPPEAVSQTMTVEQ